MRTIESMMDHLRQDQRWIHFGSSVILIIIGLMMIIAPLRLFRTIHLLLTLYFLISSIYYGLGLITHHDRDHGSRFLLSIAGTIITVFFRQLLVSTFNIVVGIYMVLIGCINGVDYYVRRKATRPGALATLVATIISFLLGILMIIFNGDDFYIIDLLIGLYFVLKGGIDLLRQVVNALEKDDRNRLYARFSMSAPVFMEAILPIVVYSSIDALRKQHGSTIGELKPIPDHCVEVWIHLNDHGFEQFGHVDVGYGSTIYSYGAHDPLSREIGGSVGKGVLLVVDRTRFLQFCLDSGETILSYTLSMSIENETLLNQRIQHLLDDAKPYDCLYKRELDQGQLPQAHDYASRVYKATTAKMYTFMRGPFRWYYVFKTNCVQLADYLLRNGQFFLIQSSGIITPGSYITYLTQEYRSKQGYVTDLKVYTDKPMV